MILLKNERARCLSRERGGAGIRDLLHGFSPVKPLLASSMKQQPKFILVTGLVSLKYDLLVLTKGFFFKGLYEKGSPSQRARN